MPWETRLEEEPFDIDPAKDRGQITYLIFDVYILRFLPIDGKGVYDWESGVESHFGSKVECLVLETHEALGFC